MRKCLSLAQGEEEEEEEESEAERIAPKYTNCDRPYVMSHLKECLSNDSNQNPETQDLDGCRPHLKSGSKWPAIPFCHCAEA